MDPCRVEAEVLAQRRDDLTELRRREEVGCATTKMQLHDFALPEQRRHHFDFAQEASNVARSTDCGACNDAIASAVETWTAAERYVDIQGKRPWRSGSGRFGGVASKVALPESRVELRRGRIRRIPRSRFVITAH